MTIVASHTEVPACMPSCIHCFISSAECCGKGRCQASVAVRAESIPSMQEADKESKIARVTTSSFVELKHE